MRANVSQQESMTHSLESRVVRTVSAKAADAAARYHDGVSIGERHIWYSHPVPVRQLVHSIGDFAMEVHSAAARPRDAEGCDGRTSCRGRAWAIS